ncbi:MAG: hypothetical protein C7B43_21570 [Sulfobacillus benefaciens]|uniref:Macro domain-containing protein n=1 Tax=Sulfobacillus benefaciens TaxID=453960 RepID=A0A2T2WFK0_9FIRM|nr:MAG: hypothetical protein C7B43_21570 [Sulfobacillus benefaciens]
MIDGLQEKKFLLCAPDPLMVAAWREKFSGDPRFEIHQSTILRPDADVWSSASDSLLGMAGGLDRAIADTLPGVYEKAQQTLRELYQGFMPVGQAVVIPTGKDIPKWLVLVPTMPYPAPLSSSEPITLAMLALLRVVFRHPALTRISVPAYGTGVGRIRPIEAAAAMRKAVIIYDHEVLS